jgi:hypothetical protein
VIPKTGDVLAIGERASVQFADDRSLLLRVTSVCKRPTYEGWAWITGYVLDQTGQAIDKREVFVQLAGLRPATVRTGPRPTAAAIAARGRGV